MPANKCVICVAEIYYNNSWYDNDKRLGAQNIQLTFFHRFHKRYVFNLKGPATFFYEDGTGVLIDHIMTLGLKAKVSVTKVRIVLHLVILLVIFLFHCLHRNCIK